MCELQTSGFSQDSKICCHVENDKVNFVSCCVIQTMSVRWPFVRVRLFGTWAANMFWF